MRTIGIYQDDSEGLWIDNSPHRNTGWSFLRQIGIYEFKIYKDDSSGMWIGSIAARAGSLGVNIKARSLTMVKKQLDEGFKSYIHGLLVKLEDSQIVEQEIQRRQDHIKKAQTCTFGCRHDN